MKGGIASGQSIDDRAAATRGFVFRGLFGRKPPEHFAGLRVEDLDENISLDRIIVEACLELSAYRLRRLEWFGKRGFVGEFGSWVYGLVAIRIGHTESPLNLARNARGRVHYALRGNI